MIVKQLSGIYAPDGSNYICLTDGANNLVSMSTGTGSGTRLKGNYAPDGSRYVTLTDGNGNLR